MRDKATLRGSEYGSTDAVPTIRLPFRTFRAVLQDNKDAEAMEAAEAEAAAAVLEAATEAAATEVLGEAVAFEVKQDLLAAEEEEAAAAMAAVGIAEAEAEALEAELAKMIADLEASDVAHDEITGMVSACKDDDGTVDLDRFKVLHAQKKREADPLLGKRVEIHSTSREDVNGKVGQLRSPLPPPPPLPPLLRHPHQLVDAPLVCSLCSRAPMLPDSPHFLLLGPLNPLYNDGH